MARSIRVLVVEDQPADAELMVRELRRVGFEVEWRRVETEDDYVRSLADPFDVILSDFDLPSFDGMRALRLLRFEGHDTPLILVSGTMGEESAVAAMREGASDYLLKDRLTRLGPAVSSALDRASLVRERRAMAAGLARAEARYRSIFENAVDGIFRATPDLRVVVANPAFARIFGVAAPHGVPERAELERLSAEAFLEPEALDALRRPLREGRSVTNFETRMRRVDGREIWVSINVRPATDERGGPCIEGTVTDVSERKRAEEELARSNDALRRSEAKFSATFRSSSVALAIIRLRDEVILDVNAGFERLVRLTAAEVVGRTAVELGIRQDSPERRRDLETLKREGFVATDAVEVRPATGEPRTALVSARVIDIEGEPCSLVTLVDVTERVRAEQRLQRFVSSSPTVIYALAVRPHGLEYVWSSENLVELTGYATSEISGPSWWTDNLHPDDRERVLAAQTAPDGFERLVQEFRFRRKDGRYVWIRDEKRMVLDATGRPRELVGAWSDVTARVELEAQLRQSQKMEAIGQLSGGVAHDFNNLLTIIDGHAWQIESEAPSPAVLDSVAVIRQASERASNLTRQLLLFGRRQAMRQREIDLNEQVAHVSKMLRRVLGEDIRVRLELAATELPVLADAGMFDQVMLNLAVNARDAMPDGGSLVVETSAVAVGEAEAARLPHGRAGEFVRVTVSDSGCGIASEDLPRIFEPFYTTKDVGKGTGLGLATVFGIVQQHNGWLTVESLPGEGATFGVYLPRSAGAPAREAAPRAAAAAGGGETLLVVEDEAAVRKLVSAVLSKLGYSVLEASSGPEALEVWRGNRERIRLLLTDLVMPDGMTGAALARRLVDERGDLRVVYTSGYSPDLAGKDLVVETGKNFLPKPFDPLELARVVRANLDG